MTSEKAGEHPNAAASRPRVVSHLVQHLAFQRRVPTSDSSSQPLVEGGARRHATEALHRTGDSRVRHRIRWHRRCIDVDGIGHERNTPIGGPVQRHQRADRRDRHQSEVLQSHDQLVKPSAASHQLVMR